MKKFIKFSLVEYTPVIFIASFILISLLTLNFLLESVLLFILFILLILLLPLAVCYVLCSKYINRIYIINFITWFIYLYLIWTVYDIFFGVNLLSTNSFSKQPPYDIYLMTVTIVISIIWYYTATNHINRHRDKFF